MGQRDKKNSITRALTEKRRLIGYRAWIAARQAFPQIPRPVCKNYKTILARIQNALIKILLRHFIVYYVKQRWTQTAQGKR